MRFHLETCGLLAALGRFRGFYHGRLLPRFRHERTLPLQSDKRVGAKRPFKPLDVWAI
jgi:hypothetical protein